MSGGKSRKGHGDVRSLSIWYAISRHSEGARADRGDFPWLLPDGTSFSESFEGIVRCRYDMVGSDVKKYCFRVQFSIVYIEQSNKRKWRI